jgi:hypothetical protein
MHISGQRSRVIDTSQNLNYALHPYPESTLIARHIWCRTAEQNSTYAVPSLAVC